MPQFTGQHFVLFKPSKKITYVIQIALPNELDLNEVKKYQLWMKGWHDGGSKRDVYARKLRLLVEMAKSLDLVPVRKAAEIPFDVEGLKAAARKKARRGQRTVTKAEDAVAPVLTNAIYTEEDVLVLFTQRDCYRVAKAWKSSGGADNITLVPGLNVRAMHLASLQFAYMMQDRPGESRRGLAYYDVQAFVSPDHKETEIEVAPTQLQPAQVGI